MKDWETSIEPPCYRLVMATINPKPTKLAALAAARKRKEEESKAQLKDNQEKNKDSESTDMSITLLDRLSEKFKDPNRIDGEKSSQNQKMSSDTLPSFDNRQNRKYRSSQRRNELLEQTENSDNSAVSNCKEVETENTRLNQNLRARPSTFAEIAVGGNEAGYYSSRRSRGSNTLTIPIMSRTKPGSCTDKTPKNPKVQSKSAGLAS